MTDPRGDRWTVYLATGMSCLLLAGYAALVLVVRDPSLRSSR